MALSWWLQIEEPGLEGGTRGWQKASHAQDRWEEVAEWESQKDGLNSSARGESAEMQQFCECWLTHVKYNTDLGRNGPLHPMGCYTEVTDWPCSVKIPLTQSWGCQDLSFCFYVFAKFDRMNVIKRKKKETFWKKSYVGYGLKKMK